MEVTSDNEWIVCSMGSLTISRKEFKYLQANQERFNHLMHQCDVVCVCIIGLSQLFPTSKKSSIVLDGQVTGDALNSVSEFYLPPPSSQEIDAPHISLQGGLLGEMSELRI